MTPHSSRAQLRRTMWRNSAGAATASTLRVAAWLTRAAFAVALAAPSCSTSSTPAVTSCSLNSDCTAGLICALGKCRSQCVDTADCPVPGSWCIDDGRNAVCETPAEKNTPCGNEADCPVPLACASDYRCRDLCLSVADCNVLGIVGRVCAKDLNGVDYCADPEEVTNGAITLAPPEGAPTSSPVVEPDGGASAIVAALPQGALIATNIGPNGGVVGVSGVTVTIPANALTSDVVITIQRSAAAGPNGTVSRVFEIGPTGTVFSRPITIAFDYTDAETGGLPPSDFAVETSAAASGASWIPLSQIVVDIYAHTIAGQTMHLSPYALVEQGQGGGAAPDASTIAAGGGDGGGSSSGSAQGDASGGDASAGGAGDATVDGGIASAVNCPPGVIGDCTGGPGATLADYPTHTGYTLALDEEFTHPLDLDNDPTFTWSDGWVQDGETRFVESQVAFDGKGHMTLTVASRPASVTPPSSSYAENAPSGIPATATLSGELRTKYNNYRYGWYEASLVPPTSAGNFISNFFVFRTPRNIDWKEIDNQETPAGLTNGTPGPAAEGTNYYFQNGNTTNADYNPAFANPNDDVPLPNGVTNNQTAFHTYAFEWEPTFVKWYFDGTLIRSCIASSTTSVNCQTFTGPVLENSTSNVPIPDESAKIIMDLWIFANTGFGGMDPATNAYPLTGTYDYVRFYKWDSDPTYPCSPTPSCIAHADNINSKNNPNDGVTTFPN